MKFSTGLLTVLSFAAVALSNPVKRDVNQVKADIANIAAKVTALDGAITAFPLTGGTLLAALGIHNSAVALETTLQTATTHVTETGAVNETDGLDILNAVAAFSPNIQHALSEIIVKKPAFAALPIGGLPALIYQDLNKLKTSTGGFATALVTNAPDVLKDQANDLKDAALAGFDPAIAAYAP
ncbi:hydrophobic surface binding protein [Panaeolus papilionaceus]|nr:hydrophobic surface binding protein [Panaeolus papilionaceus]